MARAVAFALTCAGCGTVDPGSDFQFAEVTYDQDYFYCRVEPVLFENKCGPGDPGKGDAAGGCHFNVTSFLLRDYSPRVSASCRGNRPTMGIPDAAQSNFQAAQRYMSPDPERAELLNRPTGQSRAHPRRIFATDSNAAEVIRQWATRYSSQ